MISPPFFLILSCNRITTPPSVTLTASGGEPSDLISTKCSFFNFLTSSRVVSNYLLASDTAASASAANFLAAAS